jgi:predicted DNA-binding transcriptional regulator YafY
MPYSRVHRLFKLVTLIQSQRGWTAQRLAAECGVDERTIYRDFEELQAVGVPFYFDGESGGYRIRGDFFLPPIQLAPDEALALAVLCEQIAEPEQIAYLRPAWRALAKVQAVLPASVREEIMSVSRAVKIQTAQTNAADGCIDVYERVREAIAAGRALVCRYDSHDPVAADEEFDFDPYALFFSVRAWYAVGFHAGRDAVRCLKLSRFTKVFLTERPYAIPSDFSLDGYLGNAWRMVRGPDVEVEILFDAEFAQTMSDTRWHKTQTVDFHPDGSATFRCTVAGLDEIVWWVLSMGSHCRVIRPPELARRVQEMAGATLDLYRNPTAR